jgi:ABC-type dipeptide/oligopeptide/nickel transport system ATPase component|nr:MAG TPA: ATP-dependent RNA helicase [Caudoviricetes sp.]
MAVKKADEPTSAQTTFTKEQILQSLKFSNHRDILSVLLKDGRNYTVEEIDREIQNYMKGAVK